MPAFIVESPAGAKVVRSLDRFPFQIGRQADSDLVIVDQRVSRTHARVVEANGELVIEDAGSRHGLVVNGGKTPRHVLRAGDIVEFGVEGSYRLRFSLDAVPSADVPLSKLRDVLEIARSLEQTYHPQQVLESVVDAALRLVQAERGFLFLRRTGKLEMAAARDSGGVALPESCLTVPRKLIAEALETRREAFAMNFEDGEFDPGQTVMMLDLRSSIFVPLPRAEGLLYLDSRAGKADLAAGNREILETLALEASTVLESARAFDEERQRRRLQEELTIARDIQASLLPKELPQEGWLRAAGSSMPSRAVGGDYFDLHRVAGDRFALTLADVSGKGTSAALLAALLQGAMLMAEDSPGATLSRLNNFLLERTGGEKYATLFFAILHRDGRVDYSNAGHCPPVIVSRDGTITELPATSIPIGLVEGVEQPVASTRLKHGDRIVIFSDGFTDIVAHEKWEKQLHHCCSAGPHEVLRMLEALMPAGPHEDDVTILAVEYCG